VWAKPLAGGAVAVLMLNAGDTPARVSAPLRRLGLRRASRYVVRDLWTHRRAVSAGVLTAGVDRHGVAMFRVSPGRTSRPLVAVATTGASAYLPAGAATRLTTTVTNDGPRTLHGLVVRAGAPAGWVVAPSSARLAALRSGRSATVAWTARPPAGAGWTTLQPTVSFGGRVVSGAATFDVPPPAPTGAADLTRHAWAYGSMTPTGDLSSTPKLDHSVNGTPLTINGTRYARGLGVNAWSDIRYYLGGRCRRFTADVGVDDSVPSSKDMLRGTVWVSVLADGRRLFRRYMDWTMPAAHLDLPVAGVKELRLQVDATRDWIWDDATDWAQPRVACA
jgi:alpha-galactosidase